MQRVALIALMFALASAGGGCVSLQDYEIVPPDRADELMARQHVVEAHETNTTNVFTGSKGSDPPGRHDMTLATDRVLKGDDAPATLKIEALRRPTDAERALLPTPRELPFCMTRFRIGYDTRHGDRYTHLQLLPLGLTPEGEAWMAQSGGPNAVAKH